MNHKLLNIANSVSKTSLMQNQQIPPIIGDLENDLRVILSELIANVKEFFIDIDTKLKALAVANNNDLTLGKIQGNASIHGSGVNSQTLSPFGVKAYDFDSNPRDTVKSDDSNKLSTLSTKVEALEVSLKRTQNNARLACLFV